MGRSTENVYDKYKSIGTKHAKRRLHCTWQFKEMVALIKFVDQKVKTPFLSYAINRQLQRETELNAREINHQKDYKYNKEGQLFPLIELVLKYCNKDIRNVVLETIPWKIIADSLKTRSLIDCKNKFLQILEAALKAKKVENEIKIVEFVENQKVSYEESVQWELWKNEIEGMDWREARNRFQLMKKGVKEKGKKYFGQILKEVKNKQLSKQRLEE